jgi:hypothetical protein
MKTALNVLAVIACLVWAGWELLLGYGRAFGSLRPSSDGEMGAAVIAFVSMAVLASVIGSRYSAGNRARALTVLPFVVIVAGHLSIDYYQRSSRLAARSEDRESRARSVQSRFDAIPAEFSRHDGFGEYSTLLGSILVIDEGTQTMIRVDHEPERLEAFCVGGIDGTTLELWGDLGVDHYTDDAGRTVEDRFTVVQRRRSPDRADCPYQRYTF